MSEEWPWLAYSLGALTAFACVHFRRWRIVPSMLLSALVVLTIWFVGFVAAGGRTVEAGFANELMNIGSLGLLFGALGAGAAYLLVSRGR